MKTYAVIAVILFLTMLFVPLFSILGEDVQRTAAVPYASEEQSTAENTTHTEENESGQDNISSPDEQTVRVLRTSSGNVESVDMKNYIIGCVASEMLPSYEKEALKAQAVVSYTYVLYLLGEPYSDTADITDNSSVHQAYKSRKEIKEKWGDSYEEGIKNIEEAVSEVEGQFITYEGKIIKPAYHAMSSGRTNSALDVWGKDIPYLQSVASDGDRLSPKFVSTYDFTESEMIKILSSCTDEKISEIKIGDAVKNSGGYVKSIEISGISFSGETLRNAFSLRSGAFTLSQEGEIFTFTCEGYGHGVGMSQNGAQYMAKNGSTYEEIIKHYYTGAEIKS
ncbi:MAG: stage II sporulation protein D [Acutalibacteraceae bacterium]